MNSYRAVAFVAASVLMVLPASGASACSCQKMSDKELFASSDLVVRGRMKSVTVGVDVEDPKAKSEIFRMIRGEFEVEKVLKGSLKGKTLLLHTGFGTGDCGRLAEFIGGAYWYRDKKNGVLEFGMSKTEIAGQPFYHTGICDYAKFPNGQE